MRLEYVQTVREDMINKLKLRKISIRLYWTFHEGNLFFYSQNSSTTLAGNITLFTLRTFNFQIALRFLLSHLISPLPLYYSTSQQTIKTYPVVCVKTGILDPPALTGTLFKWFSCWTFKPVRSTSCLVLFCISGCVDCSECLLAGLLKVRRLTWWEYVE